MNGSVKFIKNAAILLAKVLQQILVPLCSGSTKYFSIILYKKLLKGHSNLIMFYQWVQTSFISTCASQLSFKLPVWNRLKVVTNEKGEALGEVLTIIC
jgi:hypothetical protein